MPETTEVKIYGTETREITSSLVFENTKLQTLDRRVGKNNLYFDKELFQKSLQEWENIPVIYQKDGIHPDDFAGVIQDPCRAAEAVGGKMVGRVHNPRIVVEGGPRLMATLSIDENESEIEHLWQTGKLFPSTAFSTHSDGDRITTPPVPNHVLIFPLQVDKVVPGDFGAYVNSQEITKMTEETTLDADNLVIATHSEGKMPFSQYIRTVITKLLKRHEDETQPVDADEKDAETVTEIPPEPGTTIPPAVAVASSEQNIETAAEQVENTELKNALAECDSLKAKLEQYKHAEHESRIAKLLHALPCGMTQTEEQRNTIRNMYENDLESLLFTVLENKANEGITGKEGMQYTNSASTASPCTTVGDLSLVKGEGK